MRFNEEICKFIRFLTSKGAKPLIVGGAVRDSLLNLPIKDIDIEVYGLPEEELKMHLKSYGKLNCVGQSFSVYKVNVGNDIVDVSLPRKELKVGDGHRGFDVVADPFMSFEEASKRRDFTINSMAFDIVKNMIIDPHNGQKHLKERLLKHVSSAFSEDPLRVYRAVQFAARFDCRIDPETLALCKTLPISQLPKERVFDEIKKLLLKAKKPSIGLKLMKEVGILDTLPELKALIGVEQDPEWHPEGDVWDHTLMVVDEMAGMLGDNLQENLMYMLAAITHDFGKPVTTEFIDGRIRSRGHEEAGVEPAESFLRRLTEQKELIDDVLPLVKEHLKPMLLYKAQETDGVSDSAIRRLATRVNIEHLVNLSRADHFGRTTPDALAREFPAGDWLLERAEKLQVKNAAASPLLLGRDLLALGVSPGKKMGAMLKIIYEKQMEGDFLTKEDALSWAKENIKTLL